MIRLDRNDARMVRWMCKVRPENRISAEELRTRLKLKSMSKCLQDRRLQWLVHLEKMEDSVQSTKYRNFKVSRTFPRGSPRKQKKLFCFYLNAQVNFCPSNPVGKVFETTQPTFTCSKSTIETIKEGVKYVHN